MEGMEMAKQVFKKALDGTGNYYLGGDPDAPAFYRRHGATWYWTTGLLGKRARSAYGWRSTRREARLSLEAAMIDCSMTGHVCPA
jgi:hypothetical protein